ncbi:MAG: hypothetical protein U5R48_05880 [Gammaproteobacteria bacterium]|nr:hypothetical protein [Gammaproteobacteria bacterium]
MRFIVLLALVGLVAWALIRSLTEQRQGWLRRLALVGDWSGEQDGVFYRLRLEGAADGGRYTEVNESDGGRRRESGRWRLADHRLCFRPDDGTPSECELRLFEPGRIGIHGPGRARRIYEREADNVVFLPGRGRS